MLYIYIWQPRLWLTTRTLPCAHVRVVYMLDGKYVTIATAIMCAACTGSKVIINGECKSKSACPKPCGTGQYTSSYCTWHSEQVCRPCPTGCSACTSKTKCMLAEPGHYLNINTAEKCKTCPIGKMWAHCTPQDNALCVSDISRTNGENQCIPITLASIYNKPSTAHKLVYCTTGRCPSKYS